MKSLDILFLHPSTHILTGHGEVVRYVAMPMGTIMLADLLDRNGYAVRVVHTGLECMLNAYLKVEDIIKRYRPRFIGIDLHWYCHAYDALRIAKIVKECSDAKVVIGGMTASFFAEEIMKEFRFIDYIICGDSEVPILELMRARDCGEADVPNLYYRNGDAIKRSKRKFIADGDAISRLSCSRLELMDNWKEYIKLTHENDEPYPKLKTQGWLFIGRGCSVNCSYCGGACISHEKIFGRKVPIFRSVESVVEDLRGFEERGILCAYMDFDPYTDRRYYHKLFERIRSDGVSISAQLLVWSLTDRNFVQEMKKAFDPTFTTITISPDTGSDYVRLMNKGFYYDNDSLLRWLDMLHEEVMPVELYFASGLSHEDVDEFEKTLKLGERIVKDYLNVVGISCNPLFLEPCSPRYLNPKAFGIRLKFRSFMDFYRTYMSFSLGRPVESKLGYDTNSLTEQQIISLSQEFNERIGPMLESDKEAHILY